MATVSIPGRDPLEVPDDWGRAEVTDFVRRSYPDLFEAEIPVGPSPVTLGPDRAPLSPEARAARIASLRAELAAPIPDPEPAPSRATEVPRRIAAGALEFLKAPLAIADVQLAPLFLADRSRPVAEELARRIEGLRAPVSQLQSDLRRAPEGDAPAPESLGDVAETLRRAGPAAAAADAGTLATNFILENVPQLLSGGLVARALSAAAVPARAARVLGPLISAAPVETAGALEEYLAAGADPAAARIAAPIVGAINGLLESAPDARLLRRLGRADPQKMSAARFIVGQVFGEGGTEVAQEGATVAGRAALTGSLGPDLLDRFATAAFGGAAAGLGMGGSAELASRIAAPPAIGPIGAPVRVARGEEIPAGEVPVGSVPIAEAPAIAGLAPAREYAPIGRRKRRAAMDLARVANEEGVADLVDFVYEPKNTAEGAPIEAEFEGGRMRIYVPNIRNVDRLRGALREEKAHGWIATEAGQEALSGFLAQQPLTEPELRELQDAGYVQLPDEDAGTYSRRLSDEFVAKLNRDSGWKRRFGEVVAFVKRAIGVRLSNVQAGRLMLRNLRRAGAAAPAPLAPARMSLAPKESEALLSSIRSEFPSAPPIIEGAGPTPASFDGNNILVDPARLPTNPRDARAEILAALASSGAQIPELAPDALIEDAYLELRRVDPEGLSAIEGRLGVDAPAPRRAVVAEALRIRPARSFLRRLAERLRISPASPALDRIADSALRAMEIAEPLPRRVPLAPEQAFADANYGVWTIARPYIEALRALAMDSRFSDEDERAYRNMGNRLRSLADNARARNLGAGSESPALNPRSEKFLDEVRASGETVSGADETLHSRFLLESRARDLVHLRDAEEDLVGLIEDLARLSPNFDRAEDEAKLAGIRKEIADLAAMPPVDNRALAIRASRQRRDESKAAALVLLDPQVRMLREVIERIENSGATPRESPDPGLADARRAGTDSLILSWRPFRRRTAEAYDQFMAEVYPEKLRELAAALRAARESRADARIAVGEILAAIGGRMGLSGSREDRATADFLREQDALLRRFVVLLAGASPTDPVARLRDRISRIPDTAPAYSEAAAQLDAELGASTFVETPRYEVSGITPDDIRALFGTESRSANPELYDFFAKLPAARKKEVVRKAMKGIVDDQLAALASRRQVGTDVTEVPGRAATAEELRARFFQVVRESMDDARLSDIRAAAEAAGISPDALGRLVQFIEASDGSRNAVMEAVRAIDRSTEESALAAIREIEQSLSAPARPGVSEQDLRKARRTVSERAAPAIARFSRAQGAAADAAAGIRREISELEARRLALLRLRDMGAAELPEPESAVREMVTETEGGDIRFHSFIRADGSEASEVRIGAEDEYSQDLLERIAKWQEDARDAAAVSSNPEPETRGLRVAVPLANLYLSANFLPSELGRSPAPSTLQYLSLGSWATLWQKISTRNNLGKLVPGLRGNLLRARTRAMDSAEKYGETIRRRYVRRVLRAERAAMESLGLNPRVLGDSELLRIARNEVAHRIGRVFGSDVSAGDRFLSPELGGRTVTPELLNLLRLDREIGRKAQEFEAKRPYGGIRIDAPEGIRFVRPPAETGDFGLSRLVDPEPVRALARAYHSKDAARIAAFWDNAEESRNGLLWHFESATRADAGTPRSMAAAEAAVARRIAHGAVPAPSSIDEAVSLLAAESGRSRAEVRKDLLAELAEYGRLAMARFERDGSDTPKSRETAVGSLADDSAFVLSAAPLIYPASWYDYGTSGGMNSFVESMLRVPAREYASAALAGAAELERIAADLRKDPAAHPQEVRWFTNTVDRQLRSLFGMDRAESAANAMTYVADQLRRDAALARNEMRPDSKIARLLTGLTPFMLMWTGTAAANIQSGPVLAYFLMEPFHGKTVAAAKTLAAFASAVPHFALDRIEAALAKLGFEFGSRAERQSFLDGYGIGSSYSRAELGEIEAFARGRAALSGAGRAATAATEAASAIGMRFGAGMGDAVLNSHLLRTVVPDIFRKMQRIAAVYAGRLASEGKTFDIRDPSTYLSDADARGASEIREMLLPFADRGGSPEEILLHIAGIDARRFWRDPLAADLAQFFLTEMNVATRSNRPQGNPLLMLFGWSSHAIAKIAEAMRTRPDDPALRKLANSALSAAAISGLLGVAYFAQKLARRGVQVAQTEGAEGLRDLLLGLDGDDDEEVDGIYDALAKLARLIRAHVPGAHIPLDFAARAAGAAVTPPTDPNPTPFDRSFYSLPVREMLSELAIAPIRGIGIDPANPRTAAFGIGETILRSVISAGRGAATAIEGALAGDAGLKAAGGADLRDAARRAAGLFSIAGSFAYNLLAPEASVARSVRADIIGAARRAGIRISRPPASMMGLVPSVPVEESLRIAANRGDSEGARAILSFAHDRAYRRAIEGGKNEREAKAAGEGAVKSLLVALDPIRDAVGGPVSPEEHRKILGILGENRKVRDAIASRDRTVAAIAAEPPAGMRRFSPSPSMRSPERRPRGGRRARAPRAGYLGSRRMRRSPTSRRRALLRRRSRVRRA